MRIRRMKKKHMYRCIRLVVDILHEPERATRADIKEFRKWDEDEVLLLVAEDEDGNFMGFAGITYEDWNQTGMIEWIGLKEHARGMGVGSKLLSRMEKWTASLGGRKVYVDTDTGDEPAQAFYSKNGFVAEGVLVDWYRDGGDALWLSKRVREREI